MLGGHLRESLRNVNYNAVIVEVVMNRFWRRAKVVARRTVYFIRTGYVQTGERVNPDFPDSNFQNHLKVYKFLEQFAKGKDVLDIGCGLGYGTAYLQAGARSIVGIDISKSAIRFAHKRYPSTQTLVMDAQSLELQPESIDLAISTENFEHLSDQEKSLREVTRILRASTASVSSPLRIAMSPWRQILTIRMNSPLRSLSFCSLVTSRKLKSGPAC
jgi:SAM-dependent methyltransferase